MPRVLIVAAAAYALLGGLLSPLPDLTVQLSDPQRAAMAWVSDNTPADSRFLVLEDQRWFADRVGEWFPYLTNRVALATPQGREWQPGGFQAATNAYEDLQACSNSSVACLDDWAAANGHSYTHVMVSKELIESELGRNVDCCDRLRSALSASAKFRLVYDGPAEAIYESTSGH